MARSGSILLIKTKLLCEAGPSWTFLKTMQVCGAMRFLRSRFSVALLFKSLANLPLWTLRPLEGWISAASGPCRWVFYHSQFNVSVETGLCEYFSSYHRYCTYCKPVEQFFPPPPSVIYSIELQALQVKKLSSWKMHVYILLLVFNPFFLCVDLISALYHIMKTNIIICKKISLSLEKHKRTV